MNRIARLAMVGAVVVSSSVAARADVPAPVHEADASLMDGSLAEPVRAALVSSVGYALPPLGAGAEWVTAGEGDRPASFADFKGKVLVLQSFDTGDRLKRSEVRRARRALNGFGDEVAVVGVQTPSENRGVERLLTRHARGGHVLHDPEGAWCDELGMYREPVTIVVDREGVIRHAGVHARHLRSVVKNLVNETDGGSASASALPPRDERLAALDAGAPERDYPAHNRRLRGASDVQGKNAPELVVEQWISGEPETEGKVVIVEFWATWCGPCVRNIPHMNELAGRFDDSVTVIGVSDEDPQKVSSFVSGRRIGYTIATDRRRRLFNFPSPRGIPHAYIQSPDGVVRWQGHPARIDGDLLAGIVRASRVGTDADPMRWVADGSEG